MPLPAIIDVATRDLFTSEQELRARYTDAQVVHVIRLRDMYN